MHIHLIAIGGTGMGALAGYLKSLGHTVTGSDGPLYPPMSDYLKAWGLAPIEGYRAGNLLPRPDLVIIGNAVGQANPEAEAAIAAGIPHLSMAQAIRQFGIEGKKSLVITGTHGKTTTAALTAFLLAHAGRDPGAIVGGVLQATGRSFYAGRGNEFVVEGDEYETAFFDKGPKFLHYAPEILVIGNLEFDHLDNFADLAALEAAFAKLAAQVPARGAILAGAEFPAAMRAARAANSPARLLRFGLDPSFEISASDPEFHPEGARFSLRFAGEDWGRLETRLFGVHNLRNALAAAGAARLAGLARDEIAAGLREFPGVKRRQEFRGAHPASGAGIFDDFGHHPTAVALTLDAFRRHGHSEVWAVLEPKSYTASTRRFQSEFAGALAGRCARAFALEVWWKTKVAPENRFSAATLARELAARGTPAAACADPGALESALREALAALPAEAPRPTLLFFSSGTHGGVRDRLLET